MSRRTAEATVSVSQPRAFAICDRCGVLTNHYKLAWQRKWAGRQVVNTGLLVCRRTCLDPLEALDRTQILLPDGLPIRDPRPDLNAINDVFSLTTAAGVVLNAEAGMPLEPERLYSDNERQFLTTADGAFLMTHNNELLAPDS